MSNASVAPGDRPVRPFVGMCALAFAATLLGTSDTDWTLVAAVGAAAVVLAIVMSVVSRTWPVAAPRVVLLLPVAYDGVLAVLRHAQGGSISGYAPLAMLPVVWVGLMHGRRSVAAMTAVTACLFASPLVVFGGPLYPSTGWRAAVLWTVVAAAVGTVTRRVVESQRRAVRLAAERAVHMDRLQEVQATLLGAHLDTDAVLGLLAEAALAVARADAACVELKVGGDVVCSAVAGTAAPFLGLTLRADETITGECFRTGQILICTDSERDTRVAREACAMVGARTLIVLPLRDGADVKAVLIAWSSTPHDFRGYEAQLLTVLANTGASALVRASLIGQMSALADTDELTGLPNRRSWHRRLDEAIARSRRSGRPVTALLMDLDGFKQVNDTLGHAAGDILLKSVSAAWSGVLRETDSLGRLGGDEFAVLLEDTGEAAAVEVAKRLRQATPKPHRASIGSATWDGAENADELLARADAEMYQAKTRRTTRAKKETTQRS